MPSRSGQHRSSRQSEHPSDLDQFRGRQIQRQTHPAETRVLWLVAAHLVFLPWALGTVRLWAQWISLALAVVAFIAALRPRTYQPEHTGAGSFRLIIWPKLLKFPIFWIGLLLLGLVAIHALNPAWAYVTDGMGWWMQQIAHTDWLPAGVDVPFEIGGPWRMLMIYASAWLTVCTVWVGFTRRKTLQRLFGILAANGVLLATLGLAQRFLPSQKLFWFWTPPPNAAFFSSFIYKNHAGAYLLLTLAITAGLAVWLYFRGVRRLEKSNPAGVVAFASTVIAVSILVSYARGATLTMLGYLSVLVVGFLIHEFSAQADRRRPLVLTVLVIVFGAFLAVGYKALDLNETWTRISRGLSAGGDYSYRSRQMADQASMDMLRENWQLGAGAGTFRFLFPAYQQEYPEIVTFPGTQRRQFWQHAHNDVLEIPIELGAPGLVLIAAAAGWWLLVLLRSFFWEKPLTLVTALGALSVAAYSWWDFPFQCPAILVTWCALWPAITKWAQFEEAHLKG